jgi:Restriction endonuclease NaeI
MLDVPKGVRDLRIGGLDVDVKNTVGDNWMIPRETYLREEPCLVIASDENTHKCWLGLIMARNDYLTAPNQDKKRGVRTSAFQNILWLVEGAPYPKSRWAGLNMERLRELRKIRGGKKRAVTFFSENLRKPIHRVVIQSLLFNQLDYMKRLRKNRGARDELKKRGIALLSGIYDSALVKELKLPPLDREETMAVSPNDATEAALTRRKELIV